MTPHGMWGLIAKLGDRVEHLGPSRKRVSFAGGCESPVSRKLLARPYRTQSIDLGWVPDRVLSPLRRGVSIIDRWVHAVELEMLVRCRHCGTCRRARAAMWAERAMIEAEASSRVWMACLEFKPEVAFAMKARAQLRERARGNAWEALSSDERFRALQFQAGRYLTLWLKRLRKAGHKIRYLVAAEAHESGVPHYHAILHELGEPVRKCCMECRRKQAAGLPWRSGQGCCWEASWPHGFTKFELVTSGDERRAVRYVTKYAAKNVAARLRPSIRYGVGDNTIAGDVSPADGITSAFVAYEKSPQSILKKGLTSKPTSIFGKSEAPAGSSRDAEASRNGVRGVPAWWLAVGELDKARPGRLGVCWETNARETWEEHLVGVWQSHGTGPPEIEKSEAGRAAREAIEATWAKPWSSTRRRG